MIVKHSEVPLAPETREEALTLLRALARDSRAEDGVVEYHVTVDADDPTVARIFERYEDHAAAESHEASVHLAAFERAFEPHLDGHSTLLSFDVTSMDIAEGP